MVRIIFIMIQHINVNKVLLLTGIVSGEKKKDEKKKKNQAYLAQQSDGCDCEFTIFGVHIQYFHSEADLGLLQHPRWSTL